MADQEATGAFIRQRHESQDEEALQAAALKRRRCVPQGSSTTGEPSDALADDESDGCPTPSRYSAGPEPTSAWSNAAATDAAQGQAPARISPQPASEAHGTPNAPGQSSPLQQHNSTPSTSPWQEDLVRFIVSHSVLRPWALDPKRTGDVGVLASLQLFTDLHGCPEPPSLRQKIVSFRFKYNSLRSKLTPSGRMTPVSAWTGEDLEHYSRSQVRSDGEWKRYWHDAFFSEWDAYNEPSKPTRAKAQLKATATASPGSPTGQPQAPASPTAASPIVHSAVETESPAAATESSQPSAVWFTAPPAVGSQVSGGIAVALPAFPVPGSTFAVGPQALSSAPHAEEVGRLRAQTAQQAQQIREQWQVITAQSQQLATQSQQIASLHAKNEQQAYLLTRQSALLHHHAQQTEAEAQAAYQRSDSLVQQAQELERQAVQARTSGQ